MMRRTIQQKSIQQKTIGLVTGLIAVVVAPSLAIASNYKAANFGGSTYMTWRFERRSPSPPPSPESASNYVQVGYACVTKDTLRGIARTAYLYRYAIMANTETTDDLQ
jgi:hypothetical protein